jgi:predicted NBD/HSP70 family sugar kinase
MTVAIGIDVGGTTTRLGVVNEQFKIIARRAAPTSEIATYDGLTNWIAAGVTGELGAKCGRDREFAIGVALPGPVDRGRGCLVRSVNLPFLEGKPIAGDLASRIGVRPFLYTDADAATWGEYLAQGVRPARFVHLRLGTGVACGVVIDGRLQCTGEARTTHMPELVVEDGPDARLCKCGLRGCLETIASGAALTKAANELGYANGTGDFDKARHDGDKRLALLIERVASAVATAIANVRRRFEPSVIVLGGGVVERLSGFVARVRARASQTASPPPCVVVGSLLGDDAGVIGAARLAVESS